MQENQENEDEMTALQRVHKEVEPRSEVSVITHTKAVLRGWITDRDKSQCEKVVVPYQCIQSQEVTSNRIGVPYHCTESQEVTLNPIKTEPEAPLPPTPVMPFATPTISFAPPTVSYATPAPAMGAAYRLQLQAQYHAQLQAQYRQMDAALSICRPRVEAYNLKYTLAYGEKMRNPHGVTTEEKFYAFMKLRFGQTLSSVCHDMMVAESSFLVWRKYEYQTCLEVYAKRFSQWQATRAPWDWDALCEALCASMVALRDSAREASNAVLFSIGNHPELTIEPQIVDLTQPL